MKPGSFYMNGVGGVVSLVKGTVNRSVSPLFNVCKVFFEAGVKGASSFTDAELSTFGAMKDVYIRQLNCFVMFIWELGPVMLVLVQINNF